MIDWVTMRVNCEHEGIICNGSVVKVSKDNEIEWTSTSWLPVVGSHDSSIVIRSVTDSTIEISGNPAKWLQGHNLFGTNDLNALCWLFLNKLIKIPELKLKPTMTQMKYIKDGIYTISRVDVNETWLLNNLQDVHAAIRALELSARLKHRGAGQFKGDTLYWGKGSNRWFLKCYHKGDEINRKKSNYPDALRTPEMLDFAARSLRFEMTLKSNFLRERMLHIPANWTPETAMLLLIEALGKLEMSTKFRLNDVAMQSLKPSERTAYYTWLAGGDMKVILPKTTFYRHRSTLLKHGVDIGILRDVEKPDPKVIPLIRILEAQPVGIPDWAFEKGLVACA
jgi:II/X family phage/plasmid replication protein